MILEDYLKIINNNDSLAQIRELLSTCDLYEFSDDFGYKETVWVENNHIYVSLFKSCLSFNQNGLIPFNLNFFRDWFSVEEVRVAEMKEFSQICGEDYIKVKLIRKGKEIC